MIAPRLLTLTVFLSPLTALAASDPGKIVCLGDSITQGVGYSLNGTAFAQNGTRSWRWELFKRLVDSGTHFTFVGSSTTNHTLSSSPDEETNATYGTWRGQTFGQKHEGHFGWRADQILGISAGPSAGKAGSGKLADWLNELRGGYTPDTAIVMIGINDLKEANQSPEKLATNVDKIITLLQQDNPQIRILLCELLHVGSSFPSAETLNAKIDDYNNLHLRALASRLSTAASPISIVSMDNPRLKNGKWVSGFGGWNPSRMSHDNLHPNSEGERHIAMRIASTLGLSSQWTPVTIRNGNFEEGIVETGTARCHPLGWEIFGTPNASAVPKEIKDYSAIAESSADTTTGKPGSSYVIAGPAETGISQTLDEKLEAGRVYMLQVSIYRGSVSAGAGDYAVEIKSGGATLAKINNRDVPPFYKTGTEQQIGKGLKEYIAEFRADDFPSYIGKPIEIRLISMNNTRYIGFEDARLSWKSESTSATAER